MKYFLLFLILSSQCFADYNYSDKYDYSNKYSDNTDPNNKLSKEYIRYLEVTNYRINNLQLLNKISKTLSIIRCQNEISEYCDKLNKELDSKEVKDEL